MAPLLLEVRRENNLFFRNRQWMGAARPSGPLHNRYKYTFSPEIETTTVRTGAGGVRAAVEWTAPRGLILSIVRPKYILF